MKKYNEIVPLGINIWLISELILSENVPAIDAHIQNDVPSLFCRLSYKSLENSFVKECVSKKEVIKIKNIRFTIIKYLRSKTSLNLFLFKIMSVVKKWKDKNRIFNSCINIVTKLRG